MAPGYEFSGSLPLALCYLFIFFILVITAISNCFALPRLKGDGVPAGTRPKLSILIPARNEAAIIGDTVRAILAQKEVNFELLLLDDHSEDNTAQESLLAANGDNRLTVLTGAALPAGWLGKNWACYQLAQAAKGEVLLFCDADVGFRPGSLAALLAHFQTSQADLLAVWPTQQTESWGERLVVPLIALAIVAYLPIVAVHYLPWAVFAAANGQCLLFRRPAYWAIGGHAGVGNQIVEDVALARRLKSSGRRLRLVDGNGRVTCRMYPNWPAVRDGFAKNILAGHANSIPFLLLSTLFHWAIFVLPWLWAAGNPFWWLVVAMGLGLRALSAQMTRQRFWDALWMPLSVLLMTCITGRALRWHFQGGPRWKGRTL